MKKLLILALLISLFSYNATSSHIVGGDTKFEQIGPNQFKVTFRLIRYCNGIARQTTPQAFYSNVCNIFSTLVIL